VATPVAAFAGADFTFILNDDGTFTAFGDNSSGQLGLLQSVTPAGMPSPSAIGAPRLSRSYPAPAGLPSLAAIGAPEWTGKISPAGLPTPAAAGAPNLGLALPVPAGIPAQGAMGAPTFTQGATPIPPVTYSGNLLANGSAGDGLTDWTATGVTVVSDGSNFCFEFEATASMSQSIGSQETPTVFQLTADWLPATAYTPASVQMNAYIMVTIGYSDSTIDTFTVPAQGYIMTGLWYNISSMITADDTKSVSNMTVTVVTSGDAGKFANICLVKQTSGAVMLGQDYAGTTITAAAGLTQLAANTAVISDQFGLNPNFVTCYPNKCANSSFENFDPETLLPAYWETSGCVSDDAAFVGDYSLKLAPGEYVVQTGTLLADPGWWSWCQRGTRIALQAKGQGQIKITVLQGGSPVPLSYMIGGTMMQVPAPYGWEVNCSPDWASMDASGTLTTAMRTCNVAASVTGGPVAIRIDNIGDTNAYIDAVQIGPDWTGEWPGVYVDGPESEPNEVELVPQLFSAPYSAVGVQFTLATPVSQIFCSPNIQATIASAFAGSSFQLICQPIRGAYQGQLATTGVWVYPEGTDVPTTAAGTAAGAAITLVTFGEPVSLVHWYELNYDDSWWQTALELCTAAAPTHYSPNIWQTPPGWVDGTAWWTWGTQPLGGDGLGAELSDVNQPIGDNYFRCKFTLTTEDYITIDAVGDSDFLMYVDGSPVLSGDFNKYGGQVVAYTGVWNNWYGLSGLSMGIPIPPADGTTIFQVTCEGPAANFLECSGGVGFPVDVAMGAPIYVKCIPGQDPFVSANMIDWARGSYDFGNSLELYVYDANEIPTGTAFTVTWTAVNAVTNIYSVTLPMPAGNHIIAVKGSHVSFPDPNPAGLLVTARHSSGAQIVHSDSTWKCLPYPNPAPL
jgi:hypothetical protein